MNKPSINDIVQLAMETSKEDPIDFGMLKINEEESYNLIAMGLLENEDYFQEEYGTTLLLASMTKLIVENFVLNLKMIEVANNQIKH